VPPTSYQVAFARSPRQPSAIARKKSWSSANRSPASPYSCGTVFKITPSGILTTLYSYCSQSQCTDGYNPIAGLVQATNGDFYGTTLAGGINCASDGGCGAIFRLSVGLGPFVKTQPWTGKVGTPVTILGTDLTGATSVTFNGTPSAFTCSLRKSPLLYPPGRAAEKWINGRANCDFTTEALPLRRGQSPGAG
jgi:uncharacterized repeat protein (TIGR03803 family)